MVCQRPLPLGSHKNVMFWRCHSRQPLMIRKVVATKLSHSMNRTLVSHRAVPRCYREVGFRNDSAVGQFALCNTGQSHQDCSYGDWSGGLVAKSPYCSSKGLKFSSHHPHLTAHNHLWFQLQAIQHPLPAYTGTCTHVAYAHKHTQIKMKINLQNTDFHLWGLILAIVPKSSEADSGSLRLPQTETPNSSLPSVGLTIISVNLKFHIYIMIPAPKRPRRTKSHIRVLSTQKLSMSARVVLLLGNTIPVS